ncbi:DUF5020 family protein [Marinilabilia salmonicolor]|jgi:hypothetical protein|uniref:Uncharacterized protein DUF5020 n=1 Tax=Marinilabilia salmonicolor TaxID=989 RepID=A0A2T0X5W9_9BACT|nr:DUF5020 family protein [Marinilabilia salmonicolor]PRY94351.1 uncharacterized protein DUF5020 [Marinilabilia salmonicolor]RCW30069.1 uncharacterized protein DUF5020 [Marinilabilia salmonicolor]
MKRFFTALVIGIISVSSFSQNLQVHYDMGEDRGYATTTLEMFKPDEWGSTFFFVDFDYDTEVGESVSMAYMEIARGLKFWDNPFEIHVEYNGGFGQFAPGLAYQINDAWLFGGNYTWNSPDFNRIFTLQAMYKAIRGYDDASFQLTGVWTVNFAGGKMTFSGFADLWKEEKVFQEFNGGGLPDIIETNYVFLTEPQLWYNATDHLSLGTEIEVASNFTVEGFKVCPTAAVKWNF